MSGPPVLEVRHIARRLAVDGDLSKPEWRAIEPAVLVPTTGAQQTVQRTELRACWTEGWLYLAFDCVDRDVWGTYLKRDDPLYEEEVVEAFLSPTGDVTRYVELEVSARNVIFDARIHSPDLHRRTMTVDLGWDLPGMLTSVQVRGTLDRRDDVDEGWSVEIGIPFAGLPEALPVVPGTQWRANFYRIDLTDPPEYTAWSPTLEKQPNFHVPARFGILQFV